MDFKGKLNSALNWLNVSVEDSVNLPVVFGIFGLITYPMYYLIWLFVNHQGYENLTMRLIVVALCAGLVLKKWWPSSLEKYFGFYFYATLCYSLPFLFVYFLLKNNFSDISVLNTLTVVILSILLMDLFILVIVLFVGVLLSILFYWCTTGPINLPSNIGGILVTYCSVLIFGAIFSHRKEVIQVKKLQAMKSLGVTIAHELRTPLGSLENSLAGIDRYMPELLDAYTLAKKSDLIAGNIRTDHFVILKNLLSDMHSEIDYSNMVVSMLINNMWQKKIKSENQELVLMSKCIQKSLERYPFGSERKKSIVHWSDSHDFYCSVDSLLMTHVIFNLIKNSFYFIDKSGKGEIYIWMTNDAGFNNLFFKDTGSGISKNKINKIFDQFFTTERHGSGLGLAFCKNVMNEFGGDISCRSEEGVFTEFKLTFPLIISDVD